ncbi:creatininase [Luminiphilus syltensis NOR5-1B]|uniref:Creatininase n=1 Tax=Luminiphilus syltensis NOR5-1B TaxID=565045 RepID=B8KVB7_9GAMM|nr:creatininase family protein [Luminiphilus syltensis]EED35235.1 creatininase [Luminiphilus syltensis NOR5-1B]
MLLALSTWCEVEAYLERSRAIIVPIGSMEQHGPTGLIGTDSICPEVIAKAAAEDNPDLLVGPTFNVGCAQHHLGFPGSMTLRPSTMIAAIGDWCASLRRHGFERIYWLNGHGGNIATIAAAFVEVYAERSLSGPDSATPPLTLRQRNWWDLPSVMSVCKRLHPQNEGSHATPSEVAITYAAYPDQVRNVPLQPKVASSGGFTDAEDYRQRFPDGRIGSDPSQATVEAGIEIIDAAAKALQEDFSAFCAL